MIFINLKTYEQGTGQKGLAVVQEFQKLYDELQVPITVLAQAADIRLFASAVTIPIWGQHVDNVEYGKNTGWILPHSIIEAGAKGTMINHAEHKIPLSDVNSILNTYKSDKFDIIVSTTSPEETILMDQLRPTYVTYEPQEYIGTKTSVVDIAPDVIRNLVTHVSTPLVIGAGIHQPHHITEGLSLGAKGFLISSDVLLSDQPVQRLREYMLAYKDAHNSGA